MSLNVKSSFVAEFDAERTLVQTLAVQVGDQHVPNFEFDIEGMPCKLILSAAIQHFPDDVQQTFPTASLLKKLDARSYLAIPLMDDAGVVVRHLAVIDDEALEADERELRLRIERQRMEAQVAYLREELRSRSDLSVIVGERNGNWKVLRSTDMVALTHSTVLILGETERRRHHGRQHVV